MNHPTAQPTTHTQGQWEVKRDELEYSPEGMYLKGLVIATEDAAIAHLIEWQPPLEAEANARLLAAAPALLAALKALYTQAMQGLDQRVTHEGLTNCDVLAETRRIIHVAEGRELP